MNYTYFIAKIENYIYMRIFISQYIPNFIIFWNAAQQGDMLATTRRIALATGRPQE
jgi:hypothetical protein